MTSDAVHERYMKLALADAELASQADDVPVGCVIVKGDEVIATGSNEVERAGDVTRHAEMIAIERASQHLGSKFLDDCTLYVTLEPCAMCAGAIVLARIPKIVFGAADEKTGAVRSVFEITEDPRLNHQCTVRTGILADECSTLLSEFFKKTRDKELDIENSRTQQLEKSKGVLFLVPTPIGNLEDITIRAIRALREADVVLCEDTRRTGQLLRHLRITARRLLSNHEHNEKERSVYVAQLISEGQTVALVSDAGMPGISDPGYRTAMACIERGLRVEALPGASAVTTAVAASGLPSDAVYFVGFPPQKKGRATFLQRVLQSTATVVMFESPYRTQQLIEEICEVGGSNRRVVIARELSKVHEEYIRGTAQEVVDIVKKRGSIKGECVVLVGAAEEQE